MDSKNELQHFGILGMKWGKRNGPPYPLSGSQKSSAEKNAKKKAKSVKKVNKVAESDPDNSRTKRDIKNLSDEELRALINRLELEKKYRELSTPESKKKENRGKKLIEDILYDSTKNIGTQAVTRVMGETLNKLVSHVTKNKEDPYVNPKKGQTDKK